MKVQAGPELDRFVEQMLRDTGFFARNVMGMDTDRGTDGVADSEIGKGGIRAYGKHQQMVEFVDDEQTKFKNLQAPRKAYKSSLVEALIARVLLAHPNWAVLLLMHDFDMACQRITVIRDILRENNVVRFLYGDIRGPKWTQREFVTSLRTDRTLLDPSLKAAAPGNLPTGGHYHLIVMDDIIDVNSVVTRESIEKSIETARFIMPLRARGGIVLNVGTPYADGDLHSFLISNPEFKTLRMPVECEVVQLPDGRWTVDGDTGWPHLSLKDMQFQLGLGYNFFMSQFKLEVTTGTHQPFYRHQFIRKPWDNSMRKLTGYLLTDVATGQDPSVSALNVLAYVGLDERLRLFLLDLQVGHWPMGEFCERLLAMKAKWSGKVNHQAELMEVNATNNGYKAMLNMMSDDRKVRLNLTPLPRGTGELGKDQRIMCLQARFQANEVFVVDTVPKTWVDESKIKLLWDPEGFRHPEKGVMPAGELVDQFIRFKPGGGGRKDIPDAIACIDTIDRRTGNRICFFRKPTVQEPEKDVTRARIPGGPLPTRGGGKVASFYERAARKIRR